MIKKITLLLLFVVAFSWQGMAQVQIVEKFESGIPSDWTKVGNLNSGSTSTYLCEGSKYAYINFYDSSGNTEMSFTSPNYAGISNGTDVSVNFQWRSRPYSSNAVDYSINVDYSIDGGTTWVAISTFNVNTTNSCTSYAEVIPAADVATGSDFQFRISGTWNAGDSYFYIDDINVSQAATSVPNCDATLTTTTNAPLTDIAWSAATGAPTGYKLTVGTTSGGTDIVNAMDVGNVTSYTFASPLAGGTTYYATVTPYNTIGDATGCSEQTFTTLTPPANDDCSGAIALTVNTDLACGSVTSGTVEFATASSTDATACSGTENNDVWFSFQATGTAHQIKIQNKSGSATDMYNSVWEGTCGSLTLVAGSCSDPDTNSLTGLTIGNTYYVRVNTYSSTDADTTFDICVGTPPPPPANDDCSAATTITESTDYSCDNAVSGTTASATHSSDNTNQSSSYEDVWYVFTPSSTGNYVFSTTTNSGYSAYLTVWSGSCGSLTEMSSGSYLSSYTAALTSGTQYLVSVASLSDNSVFDLCIYPEPAAPANDDCSGATAVTESTDYNCNNAVSGVTISATHSSDNTNQASTYEDVWYTFTPATTGDYIFSTTTTNSGSSAYLTVWSGSCGSFTEISSGSTLLKIDIVAVTAGTTYYVSVASYNDTSVFDLCIYPKPAAPANDACADATEVASLPYSDSVNATGATNNDGFITACSNGMNDGIWYTFTVGTAGTVTISAAATTSWDPEIGIYTGSCGSLTCVDRVDGSSAGGTETYDLTAVAGTQYWVNVGYFSSTTDGLEGPVDVSITTADGATLGTQEAQSIAGFAYYPNPVSNQLSLRANNTIDQVEILNILGQTVLKASPSATSAAIDMTALNQGAYFVRVQVGDAIQTVKVIKN